MVVDVLLVLVIILLGSLFAAAEIALVSLRESQVRALREQGKRGQRLAKLVSDPNRFLAAVQVGVTLAGFFSAAFGAATFSAPLADLLTAHGLSEGLASSLAFVSVTVVVSYVSLVLGELAPKRRGVQRAEAYALLAAGPLDRIATLFRPVIWLLSKTTDLVVRMVGGDPHANRKTITEEELRGLVAAHESLSRDERQLIDEVFAAGARQVREVMLPRTEVDFLEANLSVSRAARTAMDSSHSRYPVVGRNSDDVIGFVHIRDLLDSDVHGGRAATVGAIAREVKRLPGTKKVLAALSEMRREGHHLAIVEDEYGGTDGIVTLEDLIEEVIGDIRDEYDQQAAAGPGRPGGPTEVDGLLNLDEFAEQTGLRLPEGPYETAGGFVMAALGRLAMPGDRVDVEGWGIEVLELDGRRVSRVRSTPPASPSPAEPAEPAESAESKAVASAPPTPTPPASPAAPPAPVSPASRTLPAPGSPSGAPASRSQGDPAAPDLPAPPDVIPNGSSTVGSLASVVGHGPVTPPGRS